MGFKFRVKSALWVGAATAVVLTATLPQALGDPGARVKFPSITSIYIKDPLVIETIQQVRSEPAAACAANASDVKAWQRGADYAKRLDTFYPEMGRLNSSVRSQLGAGVFASWDEPYSLQNVPGIERLLPGEREGLELLMSKFVSRIACGEYKVNTSTLTCCQAAYKRIARRISQRLDAARKACNVPTSSNTFASFAYAQQKAREHCRTVSAQNAADLSESLRIGQCIQRKASNIRFAVDDVLDTLRQDLRKAKDYAHVRVSYAIGELGSETFTARELEDPGFTFNSPAPVDGVGTCEKQADSGPTADTAKNSAVSGAPTVPIALYAGFYERSQKCEQSESSVASAKSFVTDYAKKYFSFSPDASSTSTPSTASSGPDASQAGIASER